MSDQIVRKEPGLGTRIREARKARGYSIETLAELVGVGFKTVSRWELGGSAIRYSDLVKIGECCGVDIGVLLPGRARKEI